MRLTPRSSRSRFGRLGLITFIPAFALAAACTDPGTSSSAGVIEAPASAFPDLPATGTPISIGLINPEGGPATSLPAYRETAEAAVAYANANLAGIAGHPIELFHCASKEDPASSRDCANRMVEAGVSAVVVTTTGYGDAMAPIITEAGIPYVSSSGASNSELSSPNAFMLTAGFPGTLTSMAKYAQANDYSEVTAYVADSGSVVPTTKALAGPKFEAAGIELQIVPVPPGTPDTAPQVHSGLSGDVDAVAVVADSTMCTSILKSFVTLSVDQDKLLITPCMDPAVVGAVGNAIEGAHVFTNADIASDDAEAVLFRSVMRKYAPDTEIDNGNMVSGYQAMLGLIRAAQGVAGEPTAEAVADAIRSAEDVPLPAGSGVTFTCDGSAEPGLPSVCSLAVVAATVTDGEPTDPRIIE